MKGKHSWTGSMRWRIVLIYFLLVFIVMVVVSVFITNSLETYQMNSLRDKLTSTVEKGSFLNTLSEYDDLLNHQEDIQKTIIDTWEFGFSEELSIVDNHFTIVASTNENITGENAAEVLNTSVLTTAIIGGEMAEADGMLSGNIPVKHLVYPFGGEDGGQCKGAVYIRADLSDIYDFSSESKFIFIYAMVLALLITAVLGVLTSKSITDPINNVTEQAERMSYGDFSRGVVVKSEDEIGRLAEMFNVLREKLDLTLSEMSNEKSKLETILKYMADGLLAVDLNGAIIHINPAATQMLDLLPEDIVDFDYDQIMAKCGKHLTMETLLEGSKSGGAQETFDFKGSVFAMRYDRFKDENGQDKGVIIVIQDITERQKLENMQTDFVANVSHELKTPLTTIKSYTETLLDGAMEDPEITASFLGIVDTEADRMNRLVKDLLQLSRLDHQRERWSMKETNLVNILNTAIPKVALTARQKEQHLNVLYDEEAVIPVNVDRDRIEQVVLNVLSNAIKYTNEGGRIDIDVLESGNYVKVIVSDNGIGISEADIPRVFERFYRVDKARSRAMGGTGLGLPISKQIVEEHHGTLTIESQEGKGTNVTMTLPLSFHRGQRGIE
ncbi:MAG: PAS domain S-box protein [Firmicutes bacterium]|nr:PAS domain S-box protein [Bacillota bacterium]MBQ2271122.1 PAS domain S-box protein [Bacillota bacterium]MBQ5797933.1 PAS domain S-box protein [Bacillota bacterium]